MGRMVLRDIRKAYAAFQNSNVVSTGRWGCGAFGGVASHKFVQQIVAAGLARCTLGFATFGDAGHCDEVLAVLQSVKPTIATLLNALLTASNAVLARNGKEFHDNFIIIL